MGYKPRIIKTLLQKKEADNKNEETLLSPAEFTKYMATPINMAWTPHITEYEVTEEDESDVRKAVRLAPRIKATGIDEIFIEALKIDCQTASKVICALWRKCGQLKYILEDWRTAILVPIYKMRNPTQPQSYRPIALLSHVRKVIEAAIAMKIRRQYKFKDSQLGFQVDTGTERAVVRHISHARVMRIAAVLDLKSANDTVPRRTLQRVLESSLDASTVNMTSLMLQGVTIRTQGDKTGTLAQVARGVCQGSPLSPTLFNIYMDTYVDWLKTKVQTVSQPSQYSPASNWNVTLFADDVKLQGKDGNTIQKLIAESELWAKQFGREWNVNICNVLWPGNIARVPQIIMNIRKIDNDSEAEYPGISASAGGTTSKANAKRLKGAVAMLHILKRHGIHSGTATSYLLLRIWNTCILPKATYGLHLVPRSNELKSDWSQLEKIMMVNILGCFSEKTRDRLRTVSRQLSLTEQREVQMSSLKKRLIRRSREVCTTDTAGEDPHRLDTARADLGYSTIRNKQNLYEQWEMQERKRVRRLPTLTVSKLVPVLTVREPTTRRAGIQWYCGTFPVLSGSVAEAIKQAVKPKLEELNRLMQASTWKAEDQTKTKELLRWMKEKLPALWA